MHIPLWSRMVILTCRKKYKGVYYAHTLLYIHITILVLIMQNVDVLELLAGCLCWCEVVHLVPVRVRRTTCRLDSIHLGKRGWGSVCFCILTMFIGGHLVRYPWSVISDWAGYRNFRYRTEESRVRHYIGYRNKLFSDIQYPTSHYA